MSKRARRDLRKPSPAAIASPPTLGYWGGVEKWVERYAAGLSVGFALLASVLIASTYTTFSYTWDEPGHIASGVELVQKHTYTYNTEHPPLTRLAVGLLPSLSGAHNWQRKSFLDEGLAILSDGGGALNSRTLALARAGILPFFWIGCWVVFSSARWISGSAVAAVVAVFLFSMTPPLVAHSGLATTDMGLTAMLLLAVYAGWRWLEEPVVWRALAFGASTGLAVLSKFSTLAFLPSIAAVGLLTWLVFERPAPGRILSRVWERGAQFLLSVALGALVIWAGYLFSFGHTTLFSFRAPAPELFSGLDLVRQHDADGHLTYMMGAVNMVGWPEFYAVALGVKTPIPILVLGLGGLVLLFSRKIYGMRGWMMTSTVLGILIFSSFFSNIRIGTRHVLPVFVGFAVAGGCAAVWALRRWKNKGLVWCAVGAVLLSLLPISLAAYPNYLAYFNPIAGSRPQDYLVDSDLDWGQDVKKLAARLKELGAQEVYFNQYAPGDLPKLLGFPPIRPLDLQGPHPGWNAVSLTPMKLGLWGDARYVYDPGFQFWPERMQPEEHVGGGILLFYRRPDR